MGPLWGPFGACGVGALLMGPRGAAGCAGHPARRRGWGVLTRHHLERTISAAGRGRLCMAPAPRPRSCPAHKSAPRTSPPKSSRGGGGNRWRSTLQGHAEGAGAGRRARGCRRAGAARRQPASACARAQVRSAPTKVPAPTPWIRRMHAAAAGAPGARIARREGRRRAPSAAAASPTGPLTGAMVARAPPRGVR